MDSFYEGRTFVDEPRIDLDKGSPGIEFFEGILNGHNSSHPDDRQFSACFLVDVPDHFR